MEEKRQTGYVRPNEAKMQLSKKTNIIEQLQQVKANLRKDFKQEKTATKSMLERLEKQRKNLTESINQTMNDINEREKKIFDIQKKDLEDFNASLSEFDKVKNELEKKKNINQKNLEQLAENEYIVYNHALMLYEDNLRLENVMNDKDDYNSKLEEKIREVKKTYPPEFDFLCDDINSHEKISELESRILSLNQQKMFEETKQGNYVKSLSKSKNLKLKNDTSLGVGTKNLENSQADRSLDEIQDKLTAKYSSNIPIDLLKNVIVYFFENKDYTKTSVLGVVYTNTQNFSDEVLEGLIKRVKEVLAFATKKVSELKKNIEANNRKVQRIKSGVRTKASVKEAEKIEEVLSIDLLDQVLLKEIIPLLNPLIEYIQQTVDNKNEATGDYRETFEEDFLEKYFAIFEALNTKYETEKSKDPKNKNQEKDTMDLVGYSTLVNLYVKKLNKKYEAISDAKASIGNIKKNQEELEADIVRCQKGIDETKQKIIDINKEIFANQTEVKVLKDGILIKRKEIDDTLKYMPVETHEIYLKKNPGLYKILLANKARLVKNDFITTREVFIEQLMIDHARKTGIIVECTKKIYSNKLDNKWYKILFEDNAVLFPKIYNNKKTLSDQMEKLNNENVILEESLNELNKTKGENINEYKKTLEKEKDKLNTQFNLYAYLSKLKFLNEQLESVEKQQEELTNSLNEKQLSLRQKEKLLTGQLDEQKLQLFDKVIEHRDIINVDIPDDISKKIIAESTIADNGGQPKDKRSVDYRTLYKKFLPLIENHIYLYNLVNKNKKVVFDVEKPNENPPEKCGYLKRGFWVDPIEGILIIKNEKINQVEKRLPLTDIKKLAIEPRVKAYVKNLREEYNEDDLTLVEEEDLIPFNLNVGFENFDLIAPNLLSYIYFSEAINFIIQKKNNILSICKIIDQEMSIPAN